MPTTTPTDQKSVKERDNLDLLELVCQLNGRLTTFPSEAMHDAYWEARKELEGRLSRLPVEQPLGVEPDRAIADLNHVVINACMNIQATSNSVVSYAESVKIIDAVKSFTKTYLSKAPVEAEQPVQGSGEWRDADEWMREYEILRQVMNMRDAVFQIVQMANSEYEKNLQL